MLNAKLKNINGCLSKSKVHKMFFLRASASQKGLKGKIRDLKQQFEELCEQQKHTKGGGSPRGATFLVGQGPVSYTHLRAHETTLASRMPSSA